MIDAEEVKKLAQLSRIEVSDEEIESLKGDINAILDYVGKIQEAVTTEPVPEAGALRNVMRDDVDPHESGIHTEKLLEAAPSREKNLFKVKKIIQQD